MRTFLSIIALLGSFTFLTAQDLFFIGEKAYPSTESFKFLGNGELMSHDLSITIAKNGEAGLIAFTTPILGGGVRIKGKALIYLDDATQITCIDRNQFDFVDDKATTIYSLTKEEVLKLKSTNINTIRFTLKCYECMSSSEEGDFTASNRTYNFRSGGKTDVSSLVRELFQ